MTNRTRFGVALGLVLFFVLALFAVWRLDRATQQATTKFELTFPIMGTVASFTFYTSPELAEQAAERARAAFDRTVELCNLRDAESELSRLNAQAYDNPFVCSPELWFLLLESRKAYLFSDGLFDISSKPLMDLWGFYRKRGDVAPSEREIAEAMTRVGLGKVEFNETDRSVRFTVPGMGLDFGGIAKGYAVDRAVEAVEAIGVRSGVVDLGGNLRLLPKPPPGQDAYRVGIRSPGNDGELLDDVLELCNVALSTSGNYERFVTLSGVQYGHIMNPKTGKSTQTSGSATVVALSAMQADWLSTSVFLGGRDLAKRAESAFRGVSVIQVERTSVVE